MASYPKNYPFYNWVPKPLGILILLFLFLPILTVGGVYSSNVGEMVGGLGIISEHIQFATFATSVGMAAFAPFFYRLVCIRREKMMCLAGFVILYLLSYVCAKTDSIFLLALCSLVMGFVRMVLMMTNLFTLIKYAFNMEATRNITPGLEPKDEEGWDKLDVEKSSSQPMIYLFFMILGQMGTWLTAWLAYEYEWQYVYYYMMGMVLVSILLVFFTMPYHNYVGQRFPINFRKFANVVVFSVFFLCIVYVLIYGKTLDWYSDSSVCWATAVAVLTGVLGIYLERMRGSHFFLFDIFKLRTVRIGIVLFLLLMILNSSSMLVNVFTGVGMKIDNWQNATLGNWCLAGYAIGVILVIVLRNKGVHFKYLFALGFLFIGFSALFMYFEVQTDGLYERMKYPVIIRSVGMVILYALTAVYANQRMPFKYLSTWICIMLTVRMVLGPAIGTSLYANGLQERQQHYVTRYAHDVDMLNPEASASFMQTVQGMQYQGKSKTEAVNMAAMSAKGRVQVQATLSGVKDLAGWTVYACLACTIFVLAIPYPKRKLLT